MKPVEFDQVQNLLAEQLKYGVFLTVAVDGVVNTMTIAWGNSGQMWDKKSFTVAVRHSRYTFELMERAEYFTISVPKKGTLKRELTVCGTLSGRDTNKIETAGLTAEYLPEIPVPVIEACELHFVCKMAYKQAMDPSLIQADYVKNKYKTHDYHTLYFGEVVGTYMREEK